MAGSDCNKSQTRTFSTVDACGIQATASRTVTWKIDTTPPVISNLPTGGNLGCNPTLPTCSGTVTATDNCDGLVAVVCSPGTVTGPDCAKQQIFTYSAVDACGNRSTSTVTYTWKIDTTPPVISNLPTGGNLGCNPTLPTCSGTVTATDNCDGLVAVVCSPGTVTGPDCAKQQIFTYSAVDACGNRSTSTVTYTWKIDTTPPVISNLPTGGNLGCNPTLPTCSGTVTATDNCDGLVAVVCSPGTVTGPDCAKQQIFTYSAVDACGNRSTSYRYLYLEDRYNASGDFEPPNWWKPRV